MPLTWYPRLLDATPEQRMNWKIAGAGYGIHWPDLDEDLSTEGLLRGAPAHERRDNPAVHRHRSRHPNKSVLIACGVSIGTHDDTAGIYTSCSSAGGPGKVERRKNATL